MSGDTPPDGRIHEARKSLKKVRAIVLLLEADDARNLGRARKRLRRVSRALSPLRDASVMQDTMRQLHEADPGLFSRESYALGKRQLSARVTTLHESARTSGTWGLAGRQLTVLAKAAKDCVLGTTA